MVIAVAIVYAGSPGTLAHGPAGRRRRRRRALLRGGDEDPRAALAGEPREARRLRRRRPPVPRQGVAARPDDRLGCRGRRRAPPGRRFRADPRLPADEAALLRPATSSAHATYEPAKLEPSSPGSLGRRPAAPRGRCRPARAASGGRPGEGRPRPRPRRGRAGDRRGTRSPSAAGTPVPLPMQGRRAEGDRADARARCRAGAAAVSAPVTLRRREAPPRPALADRAGCSSSPRTARRSSGSAARVRTRFFKALQKRGQHAATRRAVRRHLRRHPDPAVNRRARARRAEDGRGAARGGAPDDQPVRADRRRHVASRSGRPPTRRRWGSPASSRATRPLRRRPNRIHNVQLVAHLVDNALIPPRKEFSFNGTTGERNAAKGFLEAPVIINGELQNGLGGGVCQVSTTVFNAAYEAGLPITARTNHALYISHYPQGRDATVNYPDTDLKFVNDTDHWLLLRTFVSSSSLTVNLYGTPLHRRVESAKTRRSHHRAGARDGDEGPEPARRQEGRRPARARRRSRRASTASVYDAKGKLLYDDTWYSSYVGDKSIIRVGHEAEAQAEAEPKDRRRRRSAERLPADRPRSADDPTTPATTRPPPRPSPRRRRLPRRASRASASAGASPGRRRRAAVQPSATTSSPRVEHVLVAEPRAADVDDAGVHGSRSSKKTGLR